VIPLLSQAALEAVNYSRVMPGHPVPLAIVGANRIPNSIAEDAKQFMRERAPEVAVGVVDLEGLRVFAGHGLESLSSSRRPQSELRAPNVRFVDIRPSNGQSSPSIGSLYDETTAPGLSTQPAFLQLGEGVRMRPIVWDDLLRLNYSMTYQQFFAPSNTTYSFQRFTVDLSHEFALYRSTTRFYSPRDANGPDECSIDRVRSVSGCALVKAEQVKNCQEQKGQDSASCKAIPAIGRAASEFVFSLRLFHSGPGQSAVLFSADARWRRHQWQSLSQQDYRFRAPNVMLFRESFEHSIWVPLGFALSSDQGKVALERGELTGNP